MNIIGIDPGQTTGFAEIDHNGHIISVRSTTFWDAFFWTLDNHTPSSCVIVIEQGGQNRPTFDKSYVYAAKAQDKISRNVGKANGEAELLAAGFEHKGFHVVRVRPTKRKWSAYACALITGYTKRTNEHSRDALRLAHDYYREQRLLLRIK